MSLFLGVSNRAHGGIKEYYDVTDSICVYVGCVCVCVCVFPRYQSIIVN